MIAKLIKCDTSDCRVLCSESSEIDFLGVNSNHTQASSKTGKTVKKALAGTLQPLEKSSLPLSAIAQYLGQKLNASFAAGKRGHLLQVVEMRARPWIVT